MLESIDYGKGTNAKRCVPFARGPALARGALHSDGGLEASSRPIEDPRSGFGG